MDRAEQGRTIAELERENAALRRRLDEAEETLFAIRNGEIDGLVIKGEDGDQVLQRTDRAYRLLVENMSEGALTVCVDGLVLYANRQAAALCKAPLQRVIGSAVDDWVAPEDRPTLRALLRTGENSMKRVELELVTADGERVPMLVSSSVDSTATQPTFCLVLTDLRGQRKAEAMVASERMARLILEQAVEAIVVCDEQGQVTSASSAARSLCDGSPFARPFADAFPFRTDADTPFDLVSVLRGETLQHVEVVLDRQGQTLERILNAGPLLDDRRIIGCVITLTDITDRKLAEEEVERSNKRFRDIADYAQEWIWETDVEGRYTYSSQAVEKILGYTVEEILQTYFYDTFHPDDMELLKAAAAADYSAKQPMREFVSRNLHKNGHVVWLSTNGIPLLDGMGNLLGFRGADTDITERKLAEEALEHSWTQLFQAQKMEAVGRLAGGVAHDFNNLLQAMLSQAEALQLSAASPDVVEAVAEIEAHIKRGANLTRQLLLFSRREISQRQRLDLGEVVSVGVAMLRRLVPENIRLAAEVVPRRLWVEGDDGQLQQVLVNLALNARDAMPEGGTLTIRAVSSDGDAVVEVADTGHGMDEETRSHLFEPFFTTKAAGHGTGLGLAVVHGIVEQHGGRVEVWSRPGEGSRFRVVLPAVLAPAAAGGPVEAVAELPRGHGEWLLVVEDEEGARKALTKILTVLGYLVTAVGSGEEALALEEAPGFDLLLSDLVLPGIAGDELSARLGDRWPHMKVVLMSGYTEDMALRSGIERQAVNFLQKPFDMAVLARKLWSALHGEGQNGAG